MLIVAGSVSCVALTENGALGPVTATWSCDPASAPAKLRETLAGAGAAAPTCQLNKTAAGVATTCCRGAAVGLAPTGVTAATLSPPTCTIAPLVGNANPT